MVSSMGQSSGVAVSPLLVATSWLAGSCNRPLLSVAWCGGTLTAVLAVYKIGMWAAEPELCKLLARLSNVHMFSCKVHRKAAP